MKVKRPYQACLLAFCVLLASLPIAGFTPLPGPVPVPSRFDSEWQTTTAQVPAQAQTETHEPFKFGKVDQELLAQINLLDERFEKEGLVYREPALDAYLERVGKAVLAGKELEGVTWKFRALRDPEPNALALPNGSIYINTGMLALLEEESQLASVLAHEIIHVIERHTYEKNRSLRKKVLAVNIVSAIGAWTPGTGVGLAISTISPIMLMVSVAGYSRELEKEADLEGLKKLSAAGYEPDQMVKMIRLLQMDIEGEQISTFYNDHPKLQDRVNYLSSNIKSPGDKQSDQQTGDPRTQYLTQMENVDRHDVALAINSGRFRSALYVSNKLVNFHPDSSENVFYLAESYRALGPRTPALTPEELTGGAKKKAVKDRNKRTPEEQEAELMKTPAGQDTWKANQQRSEELYLRALELNRFNAMAHRGLGMLYEKIARKDEAMSEYRKYIELAPNAFDTERIKRRLEVLRGL